MSTPKKPAASKSSGKSTDKPASDESKPSSQAEQARLALEKVRAAAAQRAGGPPKGGAPGGANASRPNLRSTNAPSAKLNRRTQGK